MPFTRHSAVLSLLKVKEVDWLEAEGTDQYFGVSVDDLAAAMADVGNNWERLPLRHAEQRSGWEDALVGCLKDVSELPRLLKPPSDIPQHATTTNFPRLREILTRLLFHPAKDESEDVDVDGEDESTPIAGSSMKPVWMGEWAKPEERYHLLPPADKIAILSFMCTLAISSKAIHAHMEACEESLTALRKEKIEVNRTKKQ